jgi:hypothetical protein
MAAFSIMMRGELREAFPRVEELRPHVVSVDELLPILFVLYGMRIQLQIVPAGIFLASFLAFS